VKAAFGDTLYWIALTLSNEAFPIDILFPRQQITDEVLTESLTFFSGSAERMRRQAATNVEAIHALTCEETQFVPPQIFCGHETDLRSSRR
jgi:hypothetical protein